MLDEYYFRYLATVSIARGMQNILNVRNMEMLSSSDRGWVTGNTEGFFFLGATAPQWARASSFTMFLDHTQRRGTAGRTPLDE